MRTLLPVLAVISAAWAQTWTTGWDSKEFLQYGCKPVMFFFAKATFEPGNMGNTVGPRVSNALKSAFGVANVATEGIDYWGLPLGNFYPGGAPPWGITEMAQLLTAASACNQSEIIVAGYSQGAALTHRAVQSLPRRRQVQNRRHRDLRRHPDPARRRADPGVPHQQDAHHLQHRRRGLHGHFVGLPGPPRLREMGAHGRRLPHREAARGRRPGPLHGPRGEHGRRRERDRPAPGAGAVGLAFGVDGVGGADADAVEWVMMEGWGDKKGVVVHCPYVA
ncbi:hypothetical protein PG995_005684 [Apiospora arundinis]